MIDLLILLLKPALLAADGGSRNPLHILALLVAWPLDMLIAHTTWALVAGRPKRGEWTVSQTLERLCRDPSNPDWYLFVGVAKKINSVSPSGRHIKSIAN